MLGASMQELISGCAMQHCSPDFRRRFSTEDVGKSSVAPSSSKPTTLSVATPLRKHNRQGSSLTCSFTVKKGASCRHQHELSLPASACSWEGTEARTASPSAGWASSPESLHSCIAVDQLQSRDPQRVLFQILKPSSWQAGACRHWQLDESSPHNAGHHYARCHATSCCGDSYVLGLTGADNLMKRVSKYLRARIAKCLSRILQRSKSRWKKWQTTRSALVTTSRKSPAGQQGHQVAATAQRHQADCADAHDRSSAALHGVIPPEIPPQASRTILVTVTAWRRMPGCAGSQ